MPTANSLLWWRLAEALPLAEHAMACPTVRITHAQVAAGVAARPALIWTHTPDEDTLSSNGVPVWYDEHHDVHTAAAWTWRHTPTGVRGTPGRANPGDDYLRLDCPCHDGRPTLIELLRDGVRRRMHWLVVDTDPDAITGRDRYRVADHRDEIAPADTLWTPGTVTAGPVADETYPALVAKHLSVGDGDVLARFARPTVEQMAADLTALQTDPAIDAMPGEYPHLRLDGDIAVIAWTDSVTERLVEADRVHPDPDGHYAIGAYLWPWRIAAGH
jgi:hypothetical protein